MSDAVTRMSEQLLSGKFMCAFEVAQMEAERRRLAGEPDPEPMPAETLNATFARLPAEVEHPEVAKVRASIQPLIDHINAYFEVEGQRARATYRGRQLQHRLYHLMVEHRRQIGIAMKPLQTAVAVFPSTLFTPDPATVGGQLKETQHDR